MLDTLVAWLAAASRAAAHAGGMGRPALGRPDHAGAARARDRAGTHGADAARPDVSPGHFSPPWPPRSHLTSLVLNRLEPRQVEALIAQRVGGKVLPAAVVRHVVTRTDGVPLYVEELTKMLLASPLVREEAGQYMLTGQLGTVAIPDTLQDALMARLDQLSAAKEVAQLGAVLGREFTYELVQSIAPQNEYTLQAGLSQLVAAELLYQRGRPPRARYVFKHALIQDAAYASLLKSTRQQVHQRTAQVLEAQFPEMVATQPELLAHHSPRPGCSRRPSGTGSGPGERAVAALGPPGGDQPADDRARGAPDAPETAERIQQELRLQITLGPALMTTKGYAAPEAERAYARARALCQRGGETPQLFSVLRGLWQFYNGAGGVPDGTRAGGAVSQPGPAGRRPGAPAGGPPRAVDHAVPAGRAVAWRTPPGAGRAGALRPRSSTARWPSCYGQDPGVCCRGVAAWALWLLGYPDQALRRSSEALTLAQELAHPSSLALRADAGGHCSISCAGRRRPPTSRPRRSSPWRRSRGSHSFGRGGDRARAGHWPRRASGGADGADPPGPGGRARATGAASGGRIFLRCWPRSTAQAGQVEAGLAGLAEALAAAGKPRDER